MFKGVDTNEDVVVEATFYNPYQSGNKFWEHGFVLRNSRPNYLHWVSIDSNGDWLYFYRNGEITARGRMLERSSAIQTQPGGKNTLRVVMIGAKGWLYINGIYQDTLNLSAIDEDGWLSVFVDAEHEGNTNIANFTIWKYGSALAKQLPDVGVVPTPTPTFVQAVRKSSRISYDDLLRNNERHVGKFVHYKAEVFYVVEDHGNSYELIARITKGEYSWEDEVYLNYSGPRFLQDDIIEFVARIEGVNTTRSIPELTVIQSRLVTKSADR